MGLKNFFKRIFKKKDFDRKVMIKYIALNTKSETLNRVAYTVFMWGMEDFKQLQEVHSDMTRERLRQIVAKINRVVSENEQ